MLEKTYKYSITNEKVIEKIVEDEHAVIAHVILPMGDSLPEHYSNSNTYMIILKGEATVKLEDEAPNTYTAGDIANIGYNLKMNIKNSGSGNLELFMVKAPGPDSYLKK